MVPCTGRKIQSSVIFSYIASSKPVWVTRDLILKNESGLRTMYSRVQMLETQVGEGTSPRVPQAVLSTGCMLTLTAMDLSHPVAGQEALVC